MLAQDYGLINFVQKVNRIVSRQGLLHHA